MLRVISVVCVAGLFGVLLQGCGDDTKKSAATGEGGAATVAKAGKSGAKESAPAQQAPAAATVAAAPSAGGAPAAIEPSTLSSEPAKVASPVTAAQAVPPGSEAAQQLEVEMGQAAGNDQKEFSVEPGSIAATDLQGKEVTISKVDKAVTEGQQSVDLTDATGKTTTVKYPEGDPGALKLKQTAGPVPQAGGALTAEGLQSNTDSAASGLDDDRIRATNNLFHANVNIKIPDGQTDGSAEIPKTHVGVKVGDKEKPDETKPRVDVHLQNVTDASGQKKKHAIVSLKLPPDIFPPGTNMSKVPVHIIVKNKTSGNVLANANQILDGTIDGGHQFSLKMKDGTVNTVTQNARDARPIEMPGTGAA